MSRQLRGQGLRSRGVDALLPEIGEVLATIKIVLQEDETPNGSHDNFT